MENAYWNNAGFFDSDFDYNKNLLLERNSDLICKEKLFFYDFDDQIEYVKLMLAQIKEKKLEIDRYYKEEKKKLKEDIIKIKSELRVGQPVIPSFVIGSNGNSPGKFFRPWGVFADFRGRILVSDRMNHRIQVFKQSGEFLYQFGTEGTQNGQFRRPAGIAVDENERIIVADKDNHRIQIFTIKGAFLLSFGKNGSKPGEFNYPWGIAVNNFCQIAVSDNNKRIQLFNQKGVFLIHCFFGKGIPRGLVFRNNDLLVADFENHDIKILDKNLKLCGFFGEKGRNEGQFLRPQDLTIDKKGRIAVSDSKNYRIQIFDSNGKLCKIFGTQGNKVGQFNCSQGICFHPNGSLIVADLLNDRIQIFSKYLKQL